MKKHIVPALLVALFVAGCGETKAPESTQHQDTKTKQSLVSGPDSKQTLTLADGTVLNFNGKLIRETVSKKEEGDFQRYIFELPQESMAVEGEIFAALAKSGYARIVKNSDKDVYSVHYKKKGQAPIGATYTNVEKSTQLMLLWKI
ncbi:TPA: hypothetical protein ACHTCR_004841 [Pseudomonas putida]|uniref:hypothetical protein n=1 Tax=Pseudomonas TaxID=286 RepID=UPI00114D1624|nr:MULTISPECIES: hypothetical protein [Pseudomonas]MCE1001460.1 hypothetical protein [Pseudomonas sp. NMI1173_11]